jgi:hypothetical protein
MARKDGRKQLLLYLKPQTIEALKNKARRTKTPAYLFIERLIDRELDLPQEDGGAEVLQTQELAARTWQPPREIGSPLPARQIEDGPKYRADIAGGSLQVPEARVIARLLLEGLDEEGWQRAIEVENVLQKRSVGTAKRQTLLVRTRLEGMGPELWEIVRDGTKPAATHAMLACAIKLSPLLADFLHYTVRESFRTFQQTLPRREWNRYIERCRDRDPTMPDWAESTVEKLGDSSFRILHEAGFLTGGTKNVLRPVRIDPSVISYLKEHDEQYVLSRMQVTP